MDTEHKHFRDGAFKWRVTTFASSVLAAVLSLNVHAAAAATATPPTSEIINNTGFVLVSGYGYQGANLLFCEPKVGHIQDPNIWSVPAQQVKDGKCLVPIIGATVEHRALTAQQYLDELIGPDLVEPVGIAPMASTYGRVIAVIYYRETKRSAQ